MKDKTIKIKPKNITQKQWVNLLLELNLMKTAWKPYGVELNIQAPGIVKRYCGAQKLVHSYQKRIGMEIIVLNDGHI